MRNNINTSWGLGSETTRQSARRWPSPLSHNRSIIHRAILVSPYKSIKSRHKGNVTSAISPQPRQSSLHDDYSKTLSHHPIGNRHSRPSRPTRLHRNLSLRTHRGLGLLPNQKRKRRRSTQPNPNQNQYSRNNRYRRPPRPRSRLHPSLTRNWNRLPRFDLSYIKG